MGDKTTKTFNSTIEIVNKYMESVNLPLIKSVPAFAVDAEIKAKDTRWDYSQMPVALAELFSRAHVRRNEKEEPALDKNGNPIYTLVMSDANPALLAWLLRERGHANYRKPDRNSIVLLSKDMICNKWEITSKGLIITPRDFLVVDGQHTSVARILAFLKNPDCKVPLTIEFADYNPAIIDTGKNRTLRDLFHGEGVSDYKNMAPAMQQVWAHFTGTPHVNSKATQGTHSLVLGILGTFEQACRQYIDIIHAHNRRNGTKIGSLSKVSGLFGIFSMIDSKKAKKLCEFLHTANGVRVPDEYLNIISKMRLGEGSKSTESDYLNYRQLNAYLVHAWNHIYSGKSIPTDKKIKDVKDYPEIDGLRNLALKLALTENNIDVYLMIADGRYYSIHLKAYGLMCNEKEVEFSKLGQALGISGKEAHAIVDDLFEAKVLKGNINKGKVKFDAAVSATIKPLPKKKKTVTNTVKDDDISIVTQVTVNRK